MCLSPSSSIFFIFLSMLEFPPQVNATTTCNMGFYGREKGNIVLGEFCN